MILFLSKYPETAQEFQDGFYQRVVNIDSLFESEEKIYLTVKPFGNISKYVCEDKESKRIIIFCNIFLHLGTIIKLFKTVNLVYIQSLYNLLYTFPFVKRYKNKYVLDLHGVVPEELTLLGHNLKSKIFNFVEKITYGELFAVIGVSKKLTSYYKNKYPDVETRYLVYSILPNNLLKMTSTDILEREKSETVNFIYSGNLQQWQNIDLMLAHIKKLSRVPHYFFQILTGEPEAMTAKLVENSIGTDRIDVRAVKSNELASYYKKAHYGFILRDDVIVNNVACPTKLVEYMNYGIIPIILSEKIGDFYEMDYERINVADLNDVLPIKKSVINSQIINSIYDNNLVNREIIENIHLR